MKYNSPINQNYTTQLISTKIIAMICTHTSQRFILAIFIALISFCIQNLILKYLFDFIQPAILFWIHLVAADVAKFLQQLLLAF